MTVRHNLVVMGLLLSLLFFNGCKTEPDITLDSGGVAIKLPYLWQVPRSDDGELANSVVADPIIYGNNNVLVGGRLKTQRSIISVTSEGKQNWQWQDLLSLKNDPTYKDPIEISFGRFQLYNDLLYFPYRTSSYCVNLSSGQTAWKVKNNLGRFDFTGGLSNLYFTPGNTFREGDDERLYIGSMNDSNAERYLLTPPYGKVANPVSNGFGMIRGILPFVSQNDTLISLLYEDQVADWTKPVTTASGLYNLSKHTWVYDRAVMNPGSSEGINVPILYNQRGYYGAIRDLVCYDIMTGKVIWQRPYTQGFYSLIIANGKLYGNNQDRYTYCFDPATGQQIWKEEGSGTSTPLTYLNGVLYFLGGGDGKLHAIDANTGQHLWRVKSPDLDKNSGAWFYGVCVAVPGKDGNKGRIVATTGLNAYGYEAIR